MVSMAGLERSEVVTLFERRRAAWLAGDTNAYVALWTDDMRITLPGRDAPLVGREAYRQMIEQSFERLRPRAWTYHHIAIDGDHVLSEWTIAAELRATGKPVEWRGMGICRMDGGLIAEWREYWDPGVLRAAISS